MKGRFDMTTEQVDLILAMVERVKAIRESLALAFPCIERSDPPADGEAR